MDNNRNVVSVDSKNTSEGNVASQEVAFSSDSLSKLQQGLDKTLAKTELVRQRIEEKKAAAPSIFVCNNCKKEFKDIPGVKRHFTKSKKGCSLELGFTEKKSDIVLTIEERMLPEELALALKVQSARKAARDVAYHLNSKTTNQGGFDAARLMRYPIGNFPRALKESATEELEKFVQMRFDSSTAPKKVMAQKELELRKSRQNG